MITKITNVIEDATRVAESFEENPLNAISAEIKKFYSNHVDLATREKAKFYKEII